MNDSDRKFSSRVSHLSILIILSLACIGLALAWIPPVAQDPGYHQFADRRMLWGIPNFANVASNVPYVWVGILGWRAWRKTGEESDKWTGTAEQWAFGIVFAATAGIGLGSGYYHLAPDHSTLVWDRLPMTVCFMGLFALVLADRTPLTLGFKELGFLLGLGAGSVAYWHATELAGRGDLRPYGLVQFVPMVAIPLLIAFRSARFTGGGWLIAMIAWYAVAKGFEYFDHAVYQITHHIASGHTLKHLVGALAIYQFFLYFKHRRPVD